MLKRFRSKPPQGSHLLCDITTFSAATGSVHRRSHLQLSSYPPSRISYGKTNPGLQLLSHCITTADALNNIQHALRFANQDVAQAGNVPLSDALDAEESNPSPNHAVSGSDVCKCITPDVLDLEVGRTAVMKIMVQVLWF
ncbi:hypothetical protein YC2023_070945 [Brassica napus]